MSHLSLELHIMESHHKVLLICDKCGNCYKGKAELQRHVESHHLGKFIVTLCHVTVRNVALMICIFQEYSTIFVICVEKHSLENGTWRLTWLLLMMKGNENTSVTSVANDFWTYIAWKNILLPIMKEVLCTNVTNAHQHFGWRIICRLTSGLYIRNIDQISVTCVKKHFCINVTWSNIKKKFINEFHHLDISFSWKSDFQISFLF